MVMCAATSLEGRTMANVLADGADRAILDAKQWAIGRWPTMTPIFLSMKEVRTEHLTQRSGGPLAVDAKWRLYYDPEWVLQNSDPAMLGTVLVHEAMHILYRHHQRFNCLVSEATPNEREDANIAMDCAIWETLEESGIGHFAPKFHCKPSMFGLAPGKAWESWFWQLRKRRQEQQQGGDPQNDDEEEPQSDDNGNDPQEAGQGQGTKTFGGSCSDGNVREWEIQPGSDAEKDNPGVDENDAGPIVRKTMERIRDKQRQQGSGSGRMELEVDEFFKPRIDPRKLFCDKVRRMIRERSGRDDWTYRRPSRRHSGGQLIRPGTVGFQPNVCVVIDTSGSMLGDDIKMAIGLVRKVVDDTERVRLVAGDVRVGLDKYIAHPKQINGLIGGGGTDMARVLAQVCQDKRTKENDVVVCVTDGYTDWPSRESVDGVKIVVALTRDDCKAIVPKWLDAVSLEV